MKSPYIRDLEPNQIINGVFLVPSQGYPPEEIGRIRTFGLTLVDRTGELDAKMWDNAHEFLSPLTRRFLVKVKGLLPDFSESSAVDDA